jgi:superfamily II RNA helicase
MECFIEVAEPVIDVKFQLKKDTQKYLIDYILSYSKLDCKELAQILEASPLVLSQVLAGKDFLGSEKAKHLFQYFTILIGH